MISVLKNKRGLIYAYTEWYILNKNGQFESNGDFIYVADFWIHKKYRNNKHIKDLVLLIHRHKFSQKAKFVYWEVLRDKTGKKARNIDGTFRVSKTFKREDILNKILNMR